MERAKLHRNVVAPGRIEGLALAAAAPLILLRPVMYETI
jgi:hypothetical protein